MLQKNSRKKILIGVCSVLAVIQIVISQQTNTLGTSPEGLALIGNAEGCKTTPYQCPADVLTVGIGSTASLAPIDKNKVYSLEEIASRWVEDLKQAEACVNRYANGKSQPQGAYDALVSITFNVGCGKLQNSTLFKQARNGDYPHYCQQFNRWIYSGGKVLKGLITRREKETALCLSSHIKGAIK